MSHQPLGQALTFSIVVVSTLLWAVGSAEAQVVDVSNRSATLSAASVSVTSTVVGGVIVSVIVDQGNAGLETYLERNAVAVIGDISTGGGDTIEDLADLFGIPDADRRDFARLLFDRRRALVGVLLTPEASIAREFVAVLSR